MITLSIYGLHVMVFFVALYGASPVQLFRQHQPHQLMG